MKTRYKYKLVVYFRIFLIFLLFSTFIFNAKAQNVSNSSQLTSAISNLKSNATVVISPGIYNISSVMYLPQNISNVTIKGSAGNRDAVIIKGPGMQNSSVNFGFWLENVSGITFQDMTIRDFYQHGIIANGGADNLIFKNLHIIDIGDQFIKNNPTTDQLNGVDNGILENSLLEYTNSAPDNYTNGLDVHRGNNWIVRNNTFKNFKSNSSLAGPAVLIWNGSKNATVTGNTFINNQRDISLGLDAVKAVGTTDHSGGLIANNFISKTSAVGPDVAIAVFDSPNTKVYYNTILAGGYPSAIEYRFPRTIGVDIKNNLTNAAITSRDGASATMSNNIANAPPDIFVDSANGNLHLVLGSTTAIDKGVSVSVINDIDNQTRPIGLATDIGADEFGGATPTPVSTPSTSSEPTPTPSATPTPPTGGLKGDLNNDRIVNSLDWAIMNSRWFTSDAVADLNNDSIVNSLDFSIMNGNWLRASP